MKQKSLVKIKYLDDNVRADLNLEWPNMAILFCAVIVASVGLNTNSSPVVIGAMLISPLMGPIVGIGYGVGTNDIQLIGKATKLFIIQVIISIVSSSIYFFISPLKTLNDQLLARTSPTLWDVLIAFFGGFTGVIGSAKKSGGNVIPGVAIATALMPPLCTTGFGISQLNWRYTLGAAYLFFINSFFIVLATIIGTVYFRIKSGQKVHISLKRRLIIIICAIVIAIPSLISASAVVKKSYVDAQLDQFVETEFKNQYVAKKSIDNHTISLSVIGTHINKNNINYLKNKLKDFHLGNYDLQIKQLTKGNYITAKEFKSYINQSSEDSNNSSNNENKSDTRILTDIREKTAHKFTKNIKEIYTGELEDHNAASHNGIIVKLHHSNKKKENIIKKYIQKLADKKNIKVMIIFS